MLVTRRYGDALHAVLCAAGYNIRWLPAIVRLGLQGLLALLLGLLVTLAEALATASVVRKTNQRRMAYEAG